MQVLPDYDRSLISHLGHTRNLGYPQILLMGVLHFVYQGASNAKGTPTISDVRQNIITHNAVFLTNIKNPPN